MSLSGLCAVQPPRVLAHAYTKYFDDTIYTHSRWLRRTRSPHGTGSCQPADPSTHLWWCVPPGRRKCPAQRSAQHSCRRGVPVPCMRQTSGGGGTIARHRAASSAYGITLPAVPACPNPMTTPYIQAARTSQLQRHKILHSGGHAPEQGASYQQHGPNTQ